MLRVFLGRYESDVKIDKFKMMDLI